jgi:hypothetical protein
LTVDFLGTLPGWITAASTTTGVAAIIIAFFRRGVSMKGLLNADKADIRDHYAEELERVTTRQHECEAREALLRDRVTQLENDILGLIRIISQASANKVLLLDQNVPEEIRQMAARIVGRTELG